MTLQEQLDAQQIHNKIRDVLIEYGNEEYGDCIVDEICIITNTPTTTDIADEEGNLHPQSYYKKLDEIEELRNIILDFEVNYDAEKIYGKNRDFFEKELYKTLISL